MLEDIAAILIVSLVMVILIATGCFILMIADSRAQSDQYLCKLMGGDYHGEEIPICSGTWVSKAIDKMQ